MKAYKVEVLILDFEGYGPEQIEIMVENIRGVHSTCQAITFADIGEWTDDHPLNKHTTAKEEYQRLFPK